MAYLTKKEFMAFGFDDTPDFASLVKRAELAINLYLNGFYNQVDFETDFEVRRALVKQAVAFQVAYLSSSGIMTAEDKQSITSMRVGRTSVSYRIGHQNVSKGRSEADRYNLSIDCLNALRQAGFGYKGVSCDR